MSPTVLYIVCFIISLDVSVCRRSMCTGSLSGVTAIFHDLRAAQHFIFFGNLALFLDVMGLGSGASAAAVTQK